jgi:hypothetical protein
MIFQVSSGVGCLDVNTLAIGAIAVFRECNSISPTQVFFSVPGNDNETRLMSRIDNTRSLCLGVDSDYNDSLRVSYYGIL